MCLGTPPPSGPQKCGEKSDKKNEIGIDYLVYLSEIKPSLTALYPALNVVKSLKIRE
tara:strand:- start:562 stop:732 length:171 start_codon:yes stop_codon:yes gene_type:complete